MDKKAETKAEQKFGNNILNLIIAKTYARHSKLSEEEFLKEIGFENSGKSEDEAIRVATYNLLIETTNQLIQTKSRIKFANELLKTYLIDEKPIIEAKEGE